MRTPRVLVVEDDPVVADLLANLLPKYGYRVEIAENVTFALQKLPVGDFDLVLTDKNLPDQSGLTVLDYVKQNLPDIDVIMMTAYADMDSILRALSAGVYDYLLKPFESIDVVARTLARAIEKRQMVLENRRMMDYLRQANEQIEGMNRSLEHQVQERTRELQEANARLEQLTLTDDVTGLYNQRFLFSRLEEEFRRARRHHQGLSVIMMDIDHFKLVNDAHDHLFGSRVLKRLGEILRASVRNVDLIIRYGGDEFALLLPHTHLKEAVAVAERIRSSVQQSDFADREEEGQPRTVCRLSVSVGVAGMGESDADSPRSLLRAADKALYEAKRAGRNRVAIMEGTKVMAQVAGIR